MSEALKIDEILDESASEKNNTVNISITHLKEMAKNVETPQSPETAPGIAKGLLEMGRKMPIDSTQLSITLLFQSQMRVAM